MTKIVLIGAGSAQFGVDMLRDLFRAREELAGSQIALVDVDPEALQLMKRVADRLNEQLGRPFDIEAHLDRREALSGARFVIISIAVRRNERWRLDFEIPLKHGVRHVFGENGGPGGLFHTMRNIPIILDICRDIEAICPQALVTNFTNPEVRICLAATRYTRLRFVGLCHGIGMAQATIAHALDLPIEEVEPKACGLNHLSWVLEIRRRSDGADLYPAFKRAMAAKAPTEIQLGEYRFSVQLCHRLMDTFGYWPLPSGDHVGEYLPYAWEVCGLGGYDFDEAEKRIRANRNQIESWSKDGVRARELLGQASGERAIPIILGVLHNTHQYELAVNVPNEGCIPNLPAWAVVGVPAMVDSEGVHGLRWDRCRSTLRRSAIFKLPSSTARWKPECTGTARLPCRRFSSIPESLVCLRQTTSWKSCCSHIESSCRSFSLLDLYMTLSLMPRI